MALPTALSNNSPGQHLQDTLPTSCAESGRDCQSWTVLLNCLASLILWVVSTVGFSASGWLCTHHNLVKSQEIVMVHSQISHTLQPQIQGWQVKQFLARLLSGYCAVKPALKSSTAKTSNLVLSSITNTVVKENHIRHRLHPTTIQTVQHFTSRHS